MKQYIKKGLLFLTLTIGLASCSNDVFLGSKEGPKDDTASGPRVKFTIDDGFASTRTAVTPSMQGFAREKSITPANSYAVVFRPDGSFYKAYQLSYNTTDEYYYFDVENGGYYYMYVVANTSIDLTSAAITDAASLFNLIETTDPGADKQASTNFLMTSAKTLVDVDGYEDTQVGPVTLTRAAVRFDIDATAITGFEIKSVDIKNRFKTTLLARNGSISMTGLTKGNATDPYTETYTRGTGSGQIDASGAYVEGTSTYYVDDQQWLGVIYGCENYSDDDVTEVTIHGTLQGIKIDHTVSFNDGVTITKPKRNTIYTVTLTANGSGLGVGDINSNIVVKDWTGTETVQLKNLNDTSKPSFRLTSSQTAKDYGVDGEAATKTNPGSIIVRKATASEVTLRVTGHNIGATLNCTGHYIKASDTTEPATGVTITPGTVTNDGNGNIMQDWTIRITDAAMTGSGDYLTFQLANKYNLTTAYRNFRIVTTPKLPIEYVAPYNMGTANTFAADNNASSSAYFYWGSNTSTPTANIQAMIQGTAVSGYHLPSKAEWCSVVAPYYAQTTSNTDTSMGGDTGIRITYKVGQHTGLSDGLSETVAWGVTNSSGTYTYEVNQVFYNDYNCPNDAAHETIGYGLRFKDDASTNGEYTCAYRYEYKSADASVGGGASLTIKVTYVGADAGVTIFTISDESWWATCDYTLVLPACGHKGNSSTDYPAGSYSSATGPADGYYWSATARDASYVHDMNFHPSDVDGNNWYVPRNSFSVRLFADKE